jgi:hypothetical protein
MKPIKAPSTDPDAGLAHPAPALGDNADANEGLRMTDASRGNHRAIGLTDKPVSKIARV